MYYKKGLRCFEHVEIMSNERLTKQIHNANVERCRYRGKIRLTYHDHIDRDIRWWYKEHLLPEYLHEESNGRRGNNTEL